MSSQSQAHHLNSCYDHAGYYDLSYSSGMAGEIRFIKALLREYLGSGALRLLEPACGTGRVLLPMLEAGHVCTGFDNNPNVLDYLHSRLLRKGLHARIFKADLADFSIPGSSFDAAVCTVDTFRHLLSETGALNHLQAVSRHLVNRGIYLLALHLLPGAGYSENVSRWRDRRGSLSLHTTISVLNVDRKKREETLAIVYNAETDTSRERHRYEYTLRTYTLRQLRALLRQVPSLEIAGVYDYYAFDIKKPIALDDQAEDIMLVLRKSGRR